MGLTTKLPTGLLRQAVPTIRRIAAGVITTVDGARAAAAKFSPKPNDKVAEEALIRRLATLGTKKIERFESDGPTLVVRAVKLDSLGKAEPPKGRHYLLSVPDLEVEEDRLTSVLLEAEVLAVPVTRGFELSFDLDARPGTLNLPLREIGDRLGYGYLADENLMIPREAGICASQPFPFSVNRPGVQDTYLLQWCLGNSRIRAYRRGDGALHVDFDGPKVPQLHFTLTRRGEFRFFHSKTLIASLDMAVRVYRKLDSGSFPTVV